MYNLISPGRAAINQIFRVINEQSQPTFDENFNFISFFNWTGGGGSLSPSVSNFGNGEPKAYTGLVGTHHRPSDDESTFGKKVTPRHGVKLTLNEPTSLSYSC
jgi:meiotically up-regulated gene 157 (Mug157) protein